MKKRSTKQDTEELDQKRTAKKENDDDTNQLIYLFMVLIALVPFVKARGKVSTGLINFRIKKITLKSPPKTIGQLDAVFKKRESKNKGLSAGRSGA